MRRLLPILPSALLVARASSGVIPTGPDTDMLTKTSAGGVFVSGSAVKGDPAAVNKEFVRHAKRAGLGGFSLHSLRHIHATQLLLGGVPLHVVAQRLGHSTPVITMTTYAHVLRRAEDQAVAAAGGLLRAALRL